MTKLHNLTGVDRISIYRLDKNGNEKLLGNASARGNRKLFERWEFTGSFALTPDEPLAPYVIIAKNVTPDAVQANGGQDVSAYEFHVEIIKG